MTVQTQIIDMLWGLHKQYDLAYIFISHDLKVVRALLYRVLVMHKGEVVKQSDAVDVIDAPSHEYTRELMAAAVGR